MTYKIINQVPTFNTDSVSHRRQLAAAINELIQTLIPNNISVKRITANTTLDSTHHDVYCDTDGGAITVTLPIGIDWKEYRIINTGSAGNNVTITPNGSQKISGVNASITLSDGAVSAIRYEVTEGWW